MKANESKTIVFITGAFVHNSGWDQWKTYFEAEGYRVLAPAWPAKDAPVETLRKRQPDPAIAALRLTQVVDHFAKIIRELPEKPILIGHSMGGLMTQLLVQKDLAAAGIAIHSVPPQGVMTLKFSFLKATWGPLGLFTSANKSFLMSFKQWQYAFTNGMPEAIQRETYEQSVIPESKRISRDTLTSAAKIDFKKPHAPLLIMAGTEDHIMPASLNRTNFKKYAQNNGSVTEFKEFAGRNHFVVGQPTWRENADYILDWIERH